MTVDRDWADGIQRFYKEAAGVVYFEVIRQLDMPGLIAAAFAGDLEALRITRLVGGALRNIQSAPHRRPALCGSCPRRLRNGRYAIVAAIPLRDDPADALTFAICDHCTTTHDAIQQMALVALQRYWPDARTVTVTDPVGGRA